MLEEDPLFNCGHGAVFAADGTNQLDAALMDGATMRAGAVADVTTTRHPISLARAVMEKSPHVMLIGHGADEFREECGAGTGAEQLLLYGAALAGAGAAVEEGREAGSTAAGGRSAGADDSRWRRSRRRRRTSTGRWGWWCGIARETLRPGQRRAGFRGSFGTGLEIRRSSVRGRMRRMSRARFRRRVRGSTLFG